MVIFLLKLLNALITFILKSLSITILKVSQSGYLGKWMYNR